MTLSVVYLFSFKQTRWMECFVGVIYVNLHSRWRCCVISSELEVPSLLLYESLHRNSTGGLFQRIAVPLLMFLFAVPMKIYKLSMNYFNKEFEPYSASYVFSHHSFVLHCTNTEVIMIIAMTFYSNKNFTVPILDLSCIVRYGFLPIDWIKLRCPIIDDWYRHQIY